MNPNLDLRDIHIPAEPAFWPPAPGWWLLGGLILALLTLGAAWGRRAWRRHRRRRVAMSQLRALATTGSGPALAAAVSALLKRVALGRYPRREVAGLSGQAWLVFLDRTGGKGRFAEGPGRVLAEGPYRAGAEFDTAALVALARDWVRHNA